MFAIRARAVFNWYGGRTLRLTRSSSARIYRAFRCAAKQRLRRLPSYSPDFCSHRHLTGRAIEGWKSPSIPPRKFDACVSSIEGELGSGDQLTTIERALIHAFAGAAVHVEHLNARLLLGQPIDLAEHAQAISSLVRIAARLGTKRRARDVTSLGEILRAGR